jgi:hypothetical protein
MGFKVEYASERREVWKWYWRAWRRDLWKFHAIVVAVVAFLVMLLLGGGSAPTLLTMLAGLGCGVLSVAWMPVVPLLLFQREVRSVEIDQEGISTTIAGESFRRSWRDIDTVSEEDGYIVLLGRKGSAFLVPPRAFESRDQQQRFLSFALEALGANWASTA